MVKQTMGQDPLKAMSEDHGLLQIVERTTSVKNKIMLMTNPNEGRYNVVEATYQILISEDPQVLAQVQSGSESITRAGREVLKASAASRASPTYRIRNRNLSPDIRHSADDMQRTCTAATMRSSS